MRSRDRDAPERAGRPRAGLQAAAIFAAVVVGAGLLALAIIQLSGALDDDPLDEEAISEIAQDPGSRDDPFAYAPAREEDLVRRARLGNSHVLYAKSPGGAFASARRVARLRTEIERAAEARSLDPDLVEAMVLLESAGRTEVIAGGDDPASASGVAQILAGTATDLLGMRVDLARSRELTQRIGSSLIRAEELRRRAGKLLRQQGKKKRKQARKLLVEVTRLERVAAQARRERVAVDERFDPVAALDGMGRYLEIARERFGRDDLAVVSYHMGIGNLSDVIRAYSRDIGGAKPPPGADVADLVAAGELSYTRLFFDSSPVENRRAHEVLSGFSDDSSSYLWRVLAAQEIMRLYRDDRDELRRLEPLFTAKATAEEVFHPETETRVFDDPEELRDGLDAGELETVPAQRKLGYEIGPQLGELAADLGVERKLYRSLRPEALATLIYMSGRVGAISGKPGQKLILTSAVRDRAYQQMLVGSNSEATPDYSLHTTGYSFDILRRYESGKQAEAFQFVLDRLSDLGVIDYAVEPAAIHITVSPLVRPLLD